MKQIPLSHGKFTQVDEGDFELLSAFKWQYMKDGKNGYAVRRENNKSILMHRVILQSPKGVEVDHIDHDGLNNQRANLRHCSRAENGRNRKVQANNTSGFKGVSWNRGKWGAYIKQDKKLTHLGRFDTAEEAARAYDAEARKRFGEFASTNF